MTKCGAGRQVCHPERNQRQTTRQDSEFVIRDAIGGKAQDRIANLSFGTQPETKIQGKIANLSSVTQPETDARQDSEFVFRDAIGDKNQGKKANL